MGRINTSNMIAEALPPVYTTSGAPTSGTSGTLAGEAPPGALLVDTAGFGLYVNTNTKASPMWAPVSPTTDTVGTPIVHAFTIPNSAGGDTDLVLPRKTRVIDAWVMLQATGNLGNTYQVKNGSTAITEALAPGATDKAVGRFGSIDDAAYVVNAGGTLRVTHVRAGGSSAATVYVLGIPEA